ncbi:putative G-patch domain-containing protein [Helianthus annuus]|nr:putative G-patch domain-containing protein [Helianthus annuus]KAJ0682284.1 putative G-patch domain-containing protein [Helianthus annuus]
MNSRLVLTRCCVMGWEEGEEGLGKEKQGIKGHVKVTSMFGDLEKPKRASVF